MSRTVLSFDVGIVNLAYCILKKKEDNTFEILKWDLINLDENKLLCTHITRKGKSKDKKIIVKKKTKKNNTDEIKTTENIELTEKDYCNKNAKFAFNNENYCTTHYNAFMKNFKKIFDEKFKSDKSKDTNKCCENRCKVISEFSYEDKNLCEKHFEKLKKDYISNNTPKKVKSQNSNYKSISNLSKYLFQKLDNLKEDFLLVDDVLIENQPSLINPTMKTISALLYSYFTLRGIIDKDLTKSTISNVLFISPQNKLKINKDVTDKKLNKDNNLKKREEYIITKDLGKKYCKSLVEKEKKYTDILDNHKKNDDLCDSFLQGFYYLFYKDGDFPEQYKKTLETIAQECEKKETEKNKKKFIKDLEKSIKSIDIDF